MKTTLSNEKLIPKNMNGTCTTQNYFANWVLIFGYIGCAIVVSNNAISLIDNIKNAIHVYDITFMRVLWNDIFGSYRFVWLEIRFRNKTIPETIACTIALDFFETDIVHNIWRTEHLEQLKIVVDNMPENFIEIKLILKVISSLLPEIDNDDRHLFPQLISLRTNRTWSEFTTMKVFGIPSVEAQPNNEMTTLVFWKIVLSLLRKRKNVGNNYRLEDEFLLGIKQIICICNRGCAGVGLTEIKMWTTSFELGVYCYVQLVYSLILELDRETLNQCKVEWSVLPDTRSAIEKLSNKHPTFNGNSFLSLLG
jgi:hypothetical protein